MRDSIVQHQTRAALKNAFFIALIVIADTFGNLLLAIGMGKMPAFFATPFPDYLGAIFGSPWVMGGTLLLIVFLISKLSMYTWADLSYVLPLTASAYVVTAILGKFFLNEHVSPLRWAGVALISFGVMFVSGTPARAKRLEEDGQ